MSNTSATGGYLTPTSSQGLPGSLTLEQFIQTVIVGISGYGPTFVRPSWQVAPPKQPDIGVDWIAFGIKINKKSYSAYVQTNDDGSSTLDRQEDLDIDIQFYGPNAQENISAFLDGFQVQQNVEALCLADMGYRDASAPIHGPDLINERWVDRYICTLILTRQVLRDYAVLSFVSASGIIHTVIDGNPVNQNWQTPLPEE